MDTPTRYFVEYVTRWVEDEAPETDIIDVPSLAAAQRVYNAHRDALPQILERKNLRDVTPAGDPRGLLWDFEEAVVEDSP